MLVCYATNGTKDIATRSKDAIYFVCQDFKVLFVPLIFYSDLFRVCESSNMRICCCFARRAGFVIVYTCLVSCSRY